MKKILFILAILVLLVGCEPIKGISEKSELDKAQAIIAEVVVDPDTGEMTTLDTFAKKMATDIRLEGNLGEDPIATTYLMMVDSNFLIDEAQIIKMPDGKYVSMIDAIDIVETNPSIGIDAGILKRAVRGAVDLRQAYENYFKNLESYKVNYTVYSERYYSDDTPAVKSTRKY